jgi:hypothetical protein
MMKADQTLDGTASAKNDRQRTITMVDQLTRLYSFRGFMRASADLLAIPNGRPSCAMLLSIDLRHVKFIEHALGRESGDQLLTRTAEILRRVFRGAAVIGLYRADGIAEPKHRRRQFGGAYGVPFTGRQVLPVRSPTFRFHCTLAQEEESTQTK